MVDMGDDDRCIHYEYDGSRDQADASLLDLVDGPGEIPLVFFRSNGSPGNMSHSRITPYSLDKHKQHRLACHGMQYRAFLHERDAVSAGMAWRIILPSLLVLSFLDRDTS